MKQSPKMHTHPHRKLWQGLRLRLRLSLWLGLMLATFAIAQLEPSFLASFPNLAKLELAGGQLYYPPMATVNTPELSQTPQQVLKLEYAGENIEDTRSYFVSARYDNNDAPEDDASSQLLWTVRYNTGNLSSSIELRAHTLVLPGNGNLYSIERLNLTSPLARTSLDVQHKYSLQGNVLSEVAQPFYYIGVTSTTLRPISLLSLPEGGEPIAVVAPNTPVTILSLSMTDRGAYLLVASPFGLAGWLAVELETNPLYALTTHPITALVPASAAPEATARSTGSTAAELRTPSETSASRWLHADALDQRDRLEVLLTLDVYQILRPGALAVRLEQSSIGTLLHASCTSSLQMQGVHGKWITLRSDLLEGDDDCPDALHIRLSSSHEEELLWRAYRDNGELVEDARFILAPRLEPEHSVARHWNDALLKTIRRDFARPTVHARNLFHSSAAMYDAWAVFDTQARPYLLGNTVGDYTCDFDGFTIPNDSDTVTLQEQAISHAAYRILEHRFSGVGTTPRNLQSRPFLGYLLALGYQPEPSRDYSQGNAAALGNYIADCYIALGNQDGANEREGYVNRYYQARNDALLVGESGINSIDPNHWQPLDFFFQSDGFIDQGGNSEENTIPAFLGAEWGNVTPFALRPEHAQTHTRNGKRHLIYHDPGKPPYLGNASDAYQWGFALVAAWSSHLDPNDTTMVDISPAAIGNLPVEDLPTTFDEYQAFYDLREGRDPSPGHARNPYTGQPYASQWVKRGDYTRVLAEFWADGPESETPPGHWFTIANYVSDHPAFVPRFQGQGEPLSQLEWDVKTYFTLGGALHDAAISAWSIKGWYDYVRPISAIRYMASKGQSSDPALPHYHPDGIPLIDGIIELMNDQDSPSNPGQPPIKIRAWRGHGYASIEGVGGVDWIPAYDWMPYQRSSFVTPPFAGYVSGHSTFSRAAAEVLTLLTGDPFFPGGMGEFYAAQDNFLLFETGPSQDVILQWATYRDAADQTALSRIWGGIHPPIDDIPGRRIGIEVGKDAFAHALGYFAEDIETRSNSAP